LNPDHESIVKECVGCKHAIGDSSLGCIEMLASLVCDAYWRPEAKWLNGRHCPLASHLEKKKVEVKPVDPIKASKRSAKGK